MVEHRHCAHGVNLKRVAYRKIHSPFSRGSVMLNIMPFCCLSIQEFRVDEFCVVIVNLMYSMLMPNDTDIG